MKSNDLPTAAIPSGRNHVLLAGRTLVNFAGCDYFRLSSHPKVLAAVEAGLRHYGLNVAASRKTTGNHEIFLRLEAELAKFFAAEAAVVVSTGYVANLAAAQALAGEYTHAFIDARAHASLRDAARHLECPVIEFAHRDAAALQARVRSVPGSIRPLVLTDGMFAHDGSVAPVREYFKVLPRQGMILVDDAHGAGVLGSTGKGAPEFARVGRDRLIQTATLSKAFGVYGGVILGSRELRSKILGRSRVFAGSTPLPPPLANAALMALRLVADTSLPQRLLANTRFLKVKLRSAAWFYPETVGPIVQYTPKDPVEATALQQALIEAGIYSPLTHYGEADATGYFRFVVSSQHTKKHLYTLADVLIQHAK